METIDILIIGGGAAGIAVALAVLEKARQGWFVESLTIVDKSEEPGTGLAYSESARGTALNRQDIAMSLMPGQPNHFKDWKTRRGMVERDGSGYTDREVYGAYLKDMLCDINSTAWKLKVHFGLIRKEAVGLEFCGEGDTAHYRVDLADGYAIWAKRVVLALGSFPAVKKAHLLDTMGYFPTPWPTKKIKEIPTDAAVGIVGAGASAIDVVALLYQRKHRGRIYMMSRSGEFPRVERASRPFQQAHTLYTPARRLETGELSLEECLNDVGFILASPYIDTDGGAHDNAENPKKGHGDRVFAGIDEDMEKVNRRETLLPKVPSVILKSIGERIWRFATLTDGVSFLENHPTWRLIRQETMPVAYAAALRKSRQRGQLEVIKDDGVGSGAGHQFSMGRFNKIPVDCVIEATGLEHDVGVLSLESPILKQMVQRKLIHADPRGGIKVGFLDLRAGPNLYALGSLTKGTHYFVEDISRITCHASRISDGLVGLPPSQPLQVALFVNPDLFSEIIMMELVPKLLAMGHMPFVFHPEPPDDSIYLEAHERGYHYIKSFMLSQAILPDYKSHGGPPEVALATASLENEYGVLVREIGDLCDPSLPSTLRLHHIDIGIMIGPTKEAEGEICTDCPLLLLKPGLAPLYVDIEVAMRCGWERFGYSLVWRCTKAQDDGVVAMKHRSIVGAPCVCSAMVDCCGAGAEMAAEAVSKFARRLPLRSASRTSPLGKRPAGTVAGPPPKLVDPPSAVPRILSRFATPESWDRLRKTIDGDLRCWSS
ncbi:FAD-NAD(P)-binding-domain-containing protein [Durotheca rogersii]|uniref:FAD-NAD(P)-binding-domain-containing protein n=1 Tax=Durotheca rogersii TaxID=419775 RepID=UPI00221F1D34|nr:FAD-NAD(P)-binding-domain-containing protein [Durotheca rogersii]KAI5863604.1 FAD-NAD(P)-binding-domain-containing protein [Durotheca rogersii]